jgi:hypothetical protein
MVPGFNNWKNDIYMSLGQEGFTGSMDKEEFTTDELDQLNAIIAEEETQDINAVPLRWANNPVRTVSTTMPMTVDKEPVQTKKLDVEPRITKPVATKLNKNPKMTMPETDKEPESPALDEVDEEDATPVVTKAVVTKEGFTGSQVGLMSYLGRVLIVIILTAGSALINLKQTETLLNKFIDAKFLIYAKLGLFALFAYVILSVSRQ